MNCRPGHHRHPHGHKHHDDNHKRQENLAWFGVMMLLVILAFCGIALWSGHSHPITPEQPTAPINHPVVEPPNVLPPDEPPGWNPPSGDWPPAVHRGHHRGHHWHHHRRHHVGRDAGMQPCPPISGYAHDGSVISIPNPDCN